MSRSFLFEIKFLCYLQFSEPGELRGSEHGGDLGLQTVHVEPMRAGEQEKSPAHQLLAAKAAHILARDDGKLVFECVDFFPNDVG